MSQRRRLEVAALEGDGTPKGMPGDEAGGDCVRGRKKKKRRKSVELIRVRDNAPVE